jgi:hypothetical protein
VKIAIVRGGFEGVRRQHTIWSLEREVADAERVLLERVSGTSKARARLRNLQQQLINAGPTQEINHAD